MMKICDYFRYLLGRKHGWIKRLARAGLWYDGGEELRALQQLVRFAPVQCPTEKLQRAWRASGLEMPQRVRSAIKHGVAYLTISDNDFPAEI